MNTDKLIQQLEKIHHENEEVFVSAFAIHDDKTGDLRTVNMGCQIDASAILAGQLLIWAIVHSDLPPEDALEKWRRIFTRTANAMWDELAERGGGAISAERRI